MKCKICNSHIQQTEEQTANALMQRGWYPCSYCRTRAAYYEKGTFLKYAKKLLPPLIYAYVSEDTLFDVESYLGEDALQWVVVPASRKSKNIEAWAGTLMIEKYIQVLSQQQSTRPPIYTNAEEVIFDVQQAYDTKSQTVLTKLDRYKHASVLVMVDFSFTALTTWSQMILRSIFVHRQNNGLSTVLTMKRGIEIADAFRDLFTLKKVNITQRDYQGDFLESLGDAKKDLIKVLKTRGYDIQQVHHKKSPVRKKNNYRPHVLEPVNWFWKVKMNSSLLFAIEDD